MELAIPLIALGGMYVISNQNNNTKEKLTNMEYKNNNLKLKKIPQNTQNTQNTQNNPVNSHLFESPTDTTDNTQEYINPNDGTYQYFDKQKTLNNESNNNTNVYSLTGDYLSSTEFTHNNMVPFNGGKSQGQIRNNNHAESILDHHVGNGSQYITKIEQAPLFKPQDNVQLVNGTPNMTDFYQSRVNAPLKNNIVKPFETINVGPGLGKGYSNEGSGGFNSGMEDRSSWLPKTVDELRIVTNPKEEYSIADHQGPANSTIKSVGIFGKMEKNAPDTFFINSQDRWLTTTGAEKGNRPIANEVFKTSNRNETTKYIGGTPNAILKTAGYTPIKYEDTKRIQLKGPSVGPSSAAGSGPHQDGDQFLKSHTNYTNNRQLNPQQQIFGSGFSSALSAAVAPIMDFLKPVKKEEYVSNMRVYGNMGGEVPGNYVQNECDEPNTTIKETTIYQTHGNIGNQLEGGAYQVNDQQSVANQRDTTNASQYGGMSSNYGATQYDSAYRQTNNEIKEKTIVGRTNQGNAKMFNSQVNLCMSKLDSDRDNNRLWAPSTGLANGPSIQTHGKTIAPQYCNEIPNTRMESNMLQAFKENPYTHSLSSVV